MRILVAVDFSDATALVLEAAGRLARAAGAELELVHAVAPDPDFVGYVPGPQHVRDDVAHGIARERHDLQALAAGLRTAGLAAGCHVRPGSAAGVILERAAQLDADLIVIGSHGHGALHHLLAGSTSREVLLKSLRPVLVVPVGRHGKAGA